MVTACRVGRQGALEAARLETERLRATVSKKAVALHLHEGKARWV